MPLNALPWLGRGESQAEFHDRTPLRTQSSSRKTGGQGQKEEFQDQTNSKNLFGRRVSSADGKYVRRGKERVIQARNGMVFIQAWIDLQMKRERRRDIRRWLESKKARVEKQIERLDHHVKEEGRA